MSRSTKPIDPYRTEKLCGSCGLVLPIDGFHCDSSKPDGHTNTCKECAKAKSNQWYANNRSYAKERGALYYASHSDQWTGYALTLRGDQERYERKQFVGKRWRLEHKDLVRESRVRSEAKRRARQRGSSGQFTSDDVHGQYDRQDGKCFYCHKKLDKYHVDHVVPLALGGSNGPENIVIACPKCNLSKHDKHPMEFCGRLF